jgi:hypothetical protein
MRSLRSIMLRGFICGLIGGFIGAMLVRACR